MKTILVPVERHDLIDSVLKAALLLGKSFESYIEGVALGPALSPFMAADAFGAMVVYNAEVERDDAAFREARSLFEEAMRGHGLSERQGESGGACYSWNSEDASDNFVGSRGRVFDITVVGRPGLGGSSPRMSTLEAALFDSGRAVLIAPPVPPENLGEEILIAWNRSTETARAIAFALPLLKRARRTVIVTVEGGSVPGPSGEQVARSLDLNGIACEARIIASGTRSSGEAILAEAESLGCDLIVKGAYTQSRLRQMIFGGATRHIIAEANVPVLMAH